MTNEINAFSAFRYTLSSHHTLRKGDLSGSRSRNGRPHTCQWLRLEFPDPVSHLRRLCYFAVRSLRERASAFRWLPMGVIVIPRQSGKTFNHQQAMN